MIIFHLNGRANILSGTHTLRKGTVTTAYPPMYILQAVIVKNLEFRKYRLRPTGKHPVLPDCSTLHRHPCL